MTPRSATSRAALLLLLVLICLPVLSPSARAIGAPGPQHTPFMDLLAKAGAYVADYEKRVSAVVAREQYLQEIKERPRGDSGVIPGEHIDHEGERAVTTKTPIWTGSRHREMASDVLLVQLPDETWFGFRDVIEVDGSRVRDREGRLQELFVKSRASTRQVLDESARYNIGPIERNTNIPTYALLYLHPTLQHIFSFQPAGEETIDGTPTFVVAYVEARRPTIVRDRMRSRDMVSHGRYWIDPKTGVVLKTELIVGDGSTEVRSQTVVTYRMNAGLGMPVPVQMKEFYDYPSRPWDPYVECTASYSNFRRFDVKVEEKITIPK